MSGLILPTLALAPGKLTPHGEDHFGRIFDLERARWEQRIRERSGELAPIAGGAGTFSNYAETHLLDHLTGKLAYTSPTPTYLCLLTVVPDSSKTLGALPSPGTAGTVTEAAYTGYVRYLMNAAAWASAVSGGAGAPSSAQNAGIITMANCTGSSSTVIAWCLGDAASAAGNVLAWGTATSVVISTTQTPPTVAAGGLVIQLT